MPVHNADEMFLLYTKHTNIRDDPMASGMFTVLKRPGCGFKSCT